MYKYIIALVIIFSGCSKNSHEIPVPPGGNTTSAGSYAVKFDIAAQNVAAAVKHDTLCLTFHEKLTFLLNPDDYKNSSAFHLKEDFSKSSLKDFQFKVLNEDHVYRYNSIDDNFNNNIPFIAASTVTISGVKYTRLVLQRDIIFFKAFKLQQLATEAQTDILKVSTEQVGFSAWYYYDKKNSNVLNTSAILVYSKAN